MLCIKKGRDMKFLNKFLLVAGFFSLAGVVASETEAGFEPIDVGRIIIEQTPKATKGIDWQFELKNNSGGTVYLLLGLAHGEGRAVIPTKDDYEKATTKLMKDTYALADGKSIRVAGLELDNPMFYFVFTSKDKNSLYDASGEKKNITSEQQKEFKHQVMAPKNRYNVLMLGDEETLFLEIDKSGFVKPVEKTFFKRSTDSGLSLDKNILYSNFETNRPEFREFTQD